MNEDLDKALHECMNIIWKAYRQSVINNNFSAFNNCFHALYEKYDDEVVQKFIGQMGLALVPAANRQIRSENVG